MMRILIAWRGLKSSPRVTASHSNRCVGGRLAQAEEGEPPGSGFIYLHCRDADRAAEDWRQAGIEVNGPSDEDYGKREGFVTDPDGNVIRFGSPIR